MGLSCTLKSLVKSYKLTLSLLTELRWKLIYILWKIKTHPCMIDAFLYICQYLQSRITLTWEPLSLWCDLCISALIIHSINIDCASRYPARCLVWVVSWGSLRNPRNNPAFSWLGFWTNWEIRQKREQMEKQKAFANWSVDSSAEGSWSLKNRLPISHGQECGWTCSPQLSSIHKRLSPGDFFCLSWRRVRKGVERNQVYDATLVFFLWKEKTRGRDTLPRKAVVV